MSNFTPATATVVTSLPFSDTVNVSASPAGSGQDPPCVLNGQPHPAWWKYTTGPDEFVLAARAKPSTGGANYTPVLSLWTGSALSPSYYSPFCASLAGDTWLEFPVSPSTTYFFQFNPLLAFPAPNVPVTFELQGPPDNPAPNGSLFIPDEFDGFPVALVSSTTGAILRIVPFPGGEHGTQLPNGVFGVVKGSLIFQRIDSDFTVLGSVNYSPRQVTGITADHNNTFYVITSPLSSGPSTINAYLSDGTAAGNWTLPAGSAPAFHGQAVARDGSILYWTIKQVNAPIHRFDLVNNVALSDLHAGFPGEVVNGSGGGDGIVASDGTIWWGYVDNPGGPTSRLRQFSTSGTVLQTIQLKAIGTFDVLSRFALAIDDISIWCWADNSGVYDGGTFKRILMSDGSTDGLLTGIPIRGSTGTPQSDPYSVSISCPILSVVTTPVIISTNECGGGSLVGSNPTGTGDPGCTNCSPSGSLPPELPSFFSALLIGAGATTCWDIGIINAILGGMAANSPPFFPQVNSSGQARGRFYKDSPTNYEQYVDTNHGCQWAWIPHGF